MINLSAYKSVVRAASQPTPEGQLVNAVGLVLEAKGCRASIGDLCLIGNPHAGVSVHAEVVGLRGEVALLMPLGDALGLSAGAPVVRIGRAAYAPVGEALLGLQHDLELGLAVEDADLTDIFLGDVPQAADQRNEPFRIGVVLPPDRHAEPSGLARHPMGATRWVLAQGLIGRGAARTDLTRGGGIADVVEQVLRLRHPLAV